MPVRGRSMASSEPCGCDSDRDDSRRKPRAAVAAMGDVPWRTGVADTGEAGQAASSGRERGQMGGYRAYENLAWKTMRQERDQQRFFSLFAKLFQAGLATWRPCLNVPVRTIWRQLEGYFGRPRKGWREAWQSDCAGARAGQSMRPFARPGRPRWPV